jgi:hypothetical protein
VGICKEIGWLVACDLLMADGWLVRAVLARWRFGWLTVDAVQENFDFHFRIFISQRSQGFGEQNTAECLRQQA